MKNNNISNMEWIGWMDGWIWIGKYFFLWNTEKLNSNRLWWIVTRIWNGLYMYVNIYRWLNITLFFVVSIIQLVCRNTIYTISSDYKSTPRKQRQKKLIYPENLYEYKSFILYPTILWLSCLAQLIYRQMIRIFLS